MFLQKQIFMVSDECTLLKQFKSGDPRRVGFTDGAKKIPVIVGSVFGEFDFKPVLENRDELTREETMKLLEKCFQEDAEEIVQETFIKLWETRDKIKVELNFNTYITTIAKNLIYDMFRKKLVEQRYYQKFQSLIQEQLAVENELFRKNLQEVMFDSINKLSEQQREVMMLKCKGFNNDEIAELLGISKRTVEAHLNKAYKKLRQDLGEVRYYSFLLFF